MHFKKAVIGLDFSPAEDAILARLPALTSLGITTVVLAHVPRYGYLSGGGVPSEAAAQDWLDKRAGPLRTAGLEVRSAVGASGDPAEQLLALAAREAADLVVIGSRSHNTVYDIFLGNVAREVLGLTTLPVLVLHLSSGDADATRPAVDQGKLDHLLLATDFSEHAIGAEAAATGLARSVGRTTVLHVTDPHTRLRPAILEVMLEAALGAIARPIEAAGGRVDKRTAAGEPAPTIARVAAETGAGLIVVGKHGQGWVESLVIGSTAAAICETAQRPVLMVPRPSH